MNRRQFLGSVAAVGAVASVGRSVFGRGLDDDATGDLNLLVEVVVLDQIAVRYVAKHHEVRFLTGQRDHAAFQMKRMLGRS